MGNRYKRFLEKWEENTGERLMKEIKRRVKVIEVFPGKNALEKVLYLIFTAKNGEIGRLLRGFPEARHSLELLRRERYGETQDS